jgi:hypothetical protein
MTQQELADKFHDCAQGMLPAEVQEQALELIYHLEELKDVKRLTGLLHG